MSGGGLPRKMPEAYRATARAALRAGWRIERTTRHLAWTSPAGTVVITASTPGDRRARLNDLAELPRAGLPPLRGPHHVKASAGRREEAAR
jgi:hypothetical protein